MFDSLAEKFQRLFGVLRGRPSLSEGNIADAVKQIRQALLDADVNYTVVTRLIEKIKLKSLGGLVVKSVKPGEMFTKIVHDELVDLLGGESPSVHLSSTPTVWMVCGLQGSGKTTQVAKLARYMQKYHPSKKIMLVPCDLQRPAAVEQLKTLASQVGVPVFSSEEKDPIIVAKQSLHEAKTSGVDLLIVDTAGRLHLDEALMIQLLEIKEVLNPNEVFFVASAHMGQDVVKVAKEFDSRVSITGTIVTMLDGTARAGVALSIREITQKPLKFEGVGEKIEDLQLFHPKSMADRILGMGDLVNLVKKAEEQFTVKEKEEIEKKLAKGAFNYNDYLKQMQAISNMGPIKNLIKMVPGASSMMGDLDQLQNEKKMKQTQAMILAMTPKEREEKVELTPSRRRRIAAGCGLSVDEVNSSIKQMKEMKKILKDMPNFQKQFQKMGNKGNFLWH